MENERLPELNFAKDGVEIRKALLSRADIAAVKADIDLESRKLQTYGVRNLEKRFHSISRLVVNEKILSTARDLLNGPVSLVRALFFDKTPQKNWFVSWHQDRTVTLNRRTAIEGWEAWTVKDGVHHAQPPVAVLNKMITFRLHVDPSDAENGCLLVVPGTHKLGILKDVEIPAIIDSEVIVPCVVEAGDAVIMRPHILHSSKKARHPSHRRVIHLEYSSYELPNGCNWA